MEKIKGLSGYFFYSFANDVCASKAYLRLIGIDYLRILKLFSVKALA